MAGLRLDGLRKSFGSNEILKGVDLALADGEMLVIVGASGCGKSTLLRIVAGLETPTTGRVLIDGRDVTDLDPSARDIAMVFQNYALYPHMSVFENMAYGLQIRGLPRPEIRAKVDAASALLGLEALLDRKPRQLSGGQRQRVAMGRAIVRDPKLFLFDEPLSNLDAKLRVQMRGEIRRLQRRLKVTSLYVTHDQVEAMTLGDRLLVMHQGVPVQLATPTEVYARPADTYVAGFIGSPAMNLLPGLLGRNGTMVRVAGAEIDLGSQRFDRPEGHPVIVGIRPEHIVLDASGMTWPVEVVEHLGAEMLVHAGRTGETALTLRIANGTPLSDAIRVSFPAAHIHVFDQATGLRLESAGSGPSTS
jgi:sn-glycerol 3-phosphate transport system ATP-binding protein